MNRNNDFSSMISLLVDLSLRSYGTTLEEYREQNHIYRDDPKDYGDKLKPILESTHMAYVYPNDSYVKRTDFNGEKVNVNKLKYEYNPRPRDYWKLDIVTKMVYNREDTMRGFVVYPYCLKELVEFYESKNVKAKAYLVRTKFHCWDDVNGQELFEEYEHNIFGNKYGYSSRYNKFSFILFESDLGDLKSYLRLPKYFDHGEVFFIAIKANNGVTCISKLFSFINMPMLSKKDERLAVVVRKYSDDDKANKSDVDSTTNDVDSTKNDVDSTKNDVDSTKNDTDSTKNDTDSTKNDVDSTKNDVDSTKNDDDSIKNDVDSTKNDVDSTKNENTKTINKPKNKKKNNIKRKNNKKKNNKKKK